MAGSPDFPAVTMKDSRESRLKEISKNSIIRCSWQVTMKDSRESRLKELDEEHLRKQNIMLQ